MRFRGRRGDLGFDDHRSQPVNVGQAADILCTPGFVVNGCRDEGEARQERRGEACPRYSSIGEPQLVS
jgi:hypothetical protein